MKDKRWRCDSCRVVSLESALLTAPSPFDPDDSLVGCPACKSCEGFTELCEIGNCQKQASCGGPTLDGVYRRTCSAHADWLHKERG